MCESWWNRSAPQKINVNIFFVERHAPPRKSIIEIHCDVSYQNIVKGCNVSLLKRTLLCSSL